MHSDLQSPMITAFCLGMCAYLLVCGYVNRCMWAHTSVKAGGWHRPCFLYSPFTPIFWGSLPLNLKLIHSATLSGQWGWWLCPILLPSAGVMGAHYHSWLVTWVLGAQIQIPALALQELYRLSLSPAWLVLFYVLCIVILDSIIIKVFSSITVPVLLFWFSSEAQLALILANAGM